MKIVFVSSEGDEKGFFSGSLKPHDVIFVDSLEHVPEDAEIVSVFVDSRVGRRFFERCPRVRMVASRSSSVDHLDKAAAKERGVVLAHIPDYGAATVAEHTFALILGVARKLRRCMTSVRHGKGKIEELRGMELFGKTLGVIGTGRVGRHVLRIAKGFGMECLAVDAMPDFGAEKELGFRYATLEELLKASDVITLHIPLNERTRNLLDAERLAMCKKGVILINTARGDLVDIDALMEGLDNGHITGVGIDVLEGGETGVDDVAERIGAQIVDKMHDDSVSESDAGWYEGRLKELRSMMKNRQLLAHTNVFHTPHVGYNSVEAVERICLGTVSNIRGFIEGNLSQEVIVKL